MAATLHFNYIDPKTLPITCIKLPHKFYKFLPEITELQTEL